MWYANECGNVLLFDTGRLSVYRDCLMSVTRAIKIRPVGGKARGLTMSS